MTLEKEVDDWDRELQGGQQILEVGNVDEVPIGKMKHVEVQGKEVVILNIGGKFYAMDDRCGHMNALLSMGNASNDGIVTCSFHGAIFNATTGMKVREPVLAPSQQMEPLPKSWQNYMEHAGQLMSHIKTYDQQAYDVRIQGDRIKIRI